MSNIGIKTNDAGTSVCTVNSLFPAEGNIAREVQGISVERPAPIIKDFKNPYRVIENPPVNEMLGLTSLAASNSLLIDVSQHSLLTISAFIVGTSKIAIAAVGYIPEDSTKANWLPVAYLPGDMKQATYTSNKDTLTAMFSTGTITVTDSASVVWNINPRVFTFDVNCLDKVAVFVRDRLSADCTKVKLCYVLS